MRTRVEEFEEFDSRFSDEGWLRPGWDDRKTLSDLYQDSGGKLDDLSDATYEALIAVADWGYNRRVEENDG